MFKVILDLLSTAKVKSQEVEEAKKICKDQLQIRNERLRKHKEKQNSQSETK